MSELIEIWKQSIFSVLVFKHKNFHQKLLVEAKFKSLHSIYALTEFWKEKINVETFSDMNRTEKWYCELCVFVLVSISFILIWKIFGAIVISKEEVFDFFFALDFRKNCQFDTVLHLFFSVSEFILTH